MTNKPEIRKPEEGAELPKAAEPKYVQIPAEQWEAVLATVESLKKNNEKLMATADRGRMAAFESTEPKKIEPFVGLSTLEVEGVMKVIVAWRMVKDNVFVNTMGAIVQDQVVEVIFEDNTKLEMSLLDFYRKTKDRMKARIVSRVPDERGYETLTLDCADGKTRVVSTQFVN